MELIATEGKNQFDSYRTEWAKITSPLMRKRVFGPLSL